MNRPVLLVTGATGFVGSAVISRALAIPELTVRAAVRGSARRNRHGVEQIGGMELDADCDWRKAAAGVGAVVHAAARVHVMKDLASDSLGAYRRTNVVGTMRLARASADAGVGRFVFVSTIKANGDATLPGKPFTADDIVHPNDPYAISKWEAEEALRELGRESGMQIVIVRPVLVYGPGVKGNFLSMMRWLSKRVPLPLGAIDNRRSLLSVDNLADLLLQCARSPAAANETFLAADGEDLSTTALLRKLAAALHVPARLIPVPPRILRALARAAGQAEVARRLCDSLQVDIGKTEKRLGWSPPARTDESLIETARHFLQSGHLASASFHAHTPAAQ